MKWIFTDVLDAADCDKGIRRAQILTHLWIVGLASLIFYPNRDNPEQLGIPPIWPNIAV